MPKYRLVKTSTTKPDNLSSFLVTYDMVGKKKNKNKNQKTPESCRLSYMYKHMYTLNV